jgi:hypothetical protein
MEARAARRRLGVRGIAASSPPYVAIFLLKGRKNANIHACLEVFLEGIR